MTASFENVTTTSAATRRFFLAGFMGAGKTTLGRSVARELALPFFDLDERVERSASMSVRDVFEREGEAGFRRRESEALRSLVEEVTEAVVALGGGTYAVEENRELLRAAGTTVWLDVPVEELERRIDPSARPLWTDAAGARALHAHRASAYALADHRLDLANHEPEEAQRALRSLLSRLCDER